MKTKIFLLVMVLSFMVNAARVDMHVDSGATGTLVQGQAGWSPALGPDSLEVYLETLIANTDTINIWVRGGDTIKPTSAWNWTARPMTTTTILRIISVNPGCTKVGSDIDSASDWALHPDSQVFFLGGAYNIVVGDYTHLINISGTSTATRTVIGAASTQVLNCNFYNTNTGTSSGVFYTVGANNKIVGSVIVGASSGVITGGAAMWMYKDSIVAGRYGIDIQANQQFIVNCIARGGFRGITKSTNYSANIALCTVYDNDTGIYNGGGHSSFFADNIVDSNSVAGIVTATVKSDIYIANHVDPTRNNNNPWVGVLATGDVLRTEGNPLFGAGLKPASNSPAAGSAIEIGGMYK